MNRNNPKEYILKLDKNEKFLSFVEFNCFTDIGFFPNYLSIECCSCFLYLTKKCCKIYMNLLLVDPYFDNI